MRYFKTQEGFPIMANHDRPNDIEILKTEYDSIVTTRNSEAEVAKKAMENEAKENKQPSTEERLTSLEGSIAEILAILKP